MKLRIEVVGAILLSILLGWGWTEATTEPTCWVKEVHEQKEVLVPYHCKDVMEDSET